MLLRRSRTDGGTSRRGHTTPIGCWTLKCHDTGEAQSEASLRCRELDHESCQGCLESRSITTGVPGSTSPRTKRDQPEPVLTAEEERALLAKFRGMQTDIGHPSTIQWRGGSESLEAAR